MFKKLSDLENAMCKSLNLINDGDIKSALSISCMDDSIAMHQCLFNGYVENIEEWKDANGNYHFDLLGTAHVNQNGLKFLQEMSFGSRFKNSLFDILKGTIGYLLGILSTVTAEIIIWMIMQKLQNP